MHSEAQNSVICILSCLQNFIPSNPNCQGVDGIVAAYYNCVSNCTLFGKYPATFVNMPFLPRKKGYFIIASQIKAAFIFHRQIQIQNLRFLMFFISGPTNFAPVINNTAKYVLFYYQITKQSNSKPAVYRRPL